MAETRLQALLTKLERGQRKTLETLGRLSPAQWEQAIHSEPSPCTPRNLAWGQGPSGRREEAY